MKDRREAHNNEGSETWVMLTVHESFVANPIIIHVEANNASGWPRLAGSEYFESYFACTSALIGQNMCSLPKTLLSFH